jgi:hypothetical protein
VTLFLINCVHRGAGKISCPAQPELETGFSKLSEVNPLTIERLKMATGSENGERSSIRSEILEHDPYNLYNAGPSENGENSNEDERIRPASTSLSRRARSQILRGLEKGEESIVDNEFFFIGIDFGTTFVSPFRIPFSLCSTI